MAPEAVVVVVVTRDSEEGMAGEEAMVPCMGVGLAQQVKPTEVSKSVAMARRGLLWSPTRRIKLRLKADALSASLARCDWWAACDWAAHRLFRVVAQEAT
jgi:hypothetical protein